MNKKIILIICKIVNPDLMIRNWDFLKQCGEQLKYVSFCMFVFLGKRQRLKSHCQSFSNKVFFYEAEFEICAGLGSF